MDAGYVEADSRNLPTVTMACILQYFASNPSFFSPEMKNVKFLRSASESYGDDAIGRVQVKRSMPHCEVQARITPEHRVRQKPYSVYVRMNESVGSIDELSCVGCPAAAGGCKHIAAFAFWLYRRSEEPSVTEVLSYWRPARLSSVGHHTVAFRELRGGKAHETLPTDADDFFNFCKQEICEASVSTTLTGYLKEDKFESAKVDGLLRMYKKMNGDMGLTAESFLKFAEQHMTDDLCGEVCCLTEIQHESSLWYHMRFARITASKFHEALHCKTPDGSLVKTILGAKKIKDTAAMQRGRQLESKVLEVVSRSYNEEVKHCGLILSGSAPIFGASPDGIMGDYSMEVKCPSTAAAVERYIKNGRLSKKSYCQVQLQMYFSKKNFALFCVADPLFEENHKVAVYEVDYDPNFKHLITRCLHFWKEFIFPHLH